MGSAGLLTLTVLYLLWIPGAGLQHPSVRVPALERDQDVQPLAPQYQTNATLAAEQYEGLPDAPESPDLLLPCAMYATICTITSNKSTLHSASLCASSSRGLQAYLQFNKYCLLWSESQAYKELLFMTRVCAFFKRSSSLWTG